MTIPNSVPVGNGGSWQSATPYVGNGGAWHAVRNAWVGNGGTWRQFYADFGPFTASGGGFYGEGESGGGEARDITVPWSGQSAPIGISGGPTSGSFSYAWTYQSGDATITPDNTGIAQPTFSGSFDVGPANTLADSAMWNCRITDTASGYYTNLSCAFTYQYSNNTG